ncbi:MAG: c-type cytochrome [Vicinamibacterales bacterium]
MAFALAIGLAAAPVAAQELPAGEGREVAAARCLVCHEADIISGQRLTTAAWGREVDKMVRWGARVAAAEREPLVAYLAAAFPVTPAATHGAVDGGEATYRSACTTCHDDDMVDGQRLSPAGWAREVDKMIRWGARVADADKAALVNYLVARAAARAATPGR